MLQSHLEAVLSSDIVRNDPACQRILQEMTHCSENDDLIALLERLTARLTDIHGGERKGSTILSHNSRSQGQRRLTLRL